MTQLDDRAVAAQRARQGWVPTHSAAATDYISEFMTRHGGAAIDATRFVESPAGLDHRDIHSIINDRGLGERFFDIHCDFLHPADSRYVDPIFGAVFGQRDIRAWLVPTMTGAGAVSFDAVFPAEFLDDGEGGTSIDQWRLAAYDGEQWVDVTDGISVRRYRDGWITDAVDYFNTLPIRLGAAQAADGAQALELPPPPSVATTNDPAWRSPGPLSAHAEEWLANRDAARAAGTWPTEASEPSGLTNEDMFRILFDRNQGRDYELICDFMHPTDAVYQDPIFGHLQGQAAIRAWLVDIMGKTGTIEFEPISPAVLDGNVAFQEFRQVAVLPDGTRIEMVRGASVRRFAGGWLVHAADYFDVAPMLDPAVQQASAAAGSTITEADVLRYRTDLIA